jgi:hypothetical protein
MLYKMLDLYNIKYDRQTLKNHIYDVKLIDILKTQHLDITFIVRYILSDLYQIHVGDMNISIEDVIKYQSHIDKKELENALMEYNSDDDSIEDFQSYSERNSK